MSQLLDRQYRKLENSKESGIRTINHAISKRNILDGEIVISKPKNKPLKLSKKVDGELWNVNFSNDGNQYVNKNLYIAGNLITNNYPAFRVTATANQALSDGDWRTITFASSVHDNGSNFDLSNEYFVAPVKGIYFFSAYLLYEDSFSEHMDDNERLDIRIYSITDSTALGTGLYHVKHDFPDDRYLAVHCDTQSELSVGDQVRVDAYNGTGSTINTYVGTQTALTYFTGHLVCAL